MKLIRRLTEVLTQRVKDQQGVTLIELLAVIVILGIIAAIGIPALMDSREQAQVETYKTNATILTEAAKRKMLMGETYMSEPEDEDKNFNLAELLTEANIVAGEPVEGSASEDGESDFSNAMAPVDESDESKGAYELNVADGTVVYNPDGSVEEEEDATTTEDSTEEDTTLQSDESDSSSLDVEREPIEDNQ